MLNQYKPITIVILSAKFSLRIVKDLGINGANKLTFISVDDLDDDGDLPLPMLLKALLKMVRMPMLKSH
jgi:hypothetical protein